MKKPKKTAQPKVDERSKQLEDALRRALADYQNLERRVAEERQLLSTLSAAILIEKFLPILDNLESAQKHLNDQGLEIVIKQFNDLLASEGVAQIQAEGQNDNMIAKVVRKGYKINDKVLRPVQVVVERKNDSGQARMTENEGGVNQAIDQTE